MTKKAKKCIRFTLGWESGYVNTPPDPETYRGINRKAFPDWPGWEEIDKRKPIHRGTVFPTLEQKVMDFYEQKVWDKYRLEELGEAAAMAACDYLTNSGAASARLSRLPVPWKAEDIWLDRWSYLGELAAGKINDDPEKVAFWTECLRGWARRMVENLRAIRAMGD